MSALIWDQTGERYYETGVKQCALFVMDSGSYGTGVAWNGITAVTESPSGAEPTNLFADDIKYITLMSTEEFGLTIEAFTFPDEFEACDGCASLAPGATIGQQQRKKFGLVYKTAVGNDSDGYDHGYKLHIVYGCLASPSEKAYSTVNDSPEAVTFSWEVTTTPVEVGTINSTAFKPTSQITIDSRDFTDLTIANLRALEAFIYGDASATPALPTPAQVYNLITSGSATGVVPDESEG